VRDLLQALSESGIVVLFGTASALRARGALTPWLVIGEGMVFTAVGGWACHAAMAFRLVAETTSSDIRHLMEALGGFGSCSISGIGSTWVAWPFSSSS
jgi:hypothetical protein